MIMENPEQEIRQVVRSLCQGTPDEQRRTIDRYFTPDAEFVHPFCIAPRFSEGDLRLPGLRRLSSRDALRGIFQWYRMLSPKIVIDIDTALHDKDRDKMYLDMRQVFSIWFAPRYHARVRLVTVLDLVPCDLGAHRNGEPQVIGDKEKADGGEKGSPTTAVVRAGGGGGRQRQKVWRISRQEDLYQVNEFLKFTGPYWFCFWRPLWFVFQLLATAICVFLGLFVPLSPWAFQQDPAPGGVEARVEQVERYRDDEDDRDGVKKLDTKAEGKNAAAASSPTSSSSHNGGHHSASGEDSSGGGGGAKGGGNNTNGNGQQGRNSKTQSTPPRKSWKGGKKDGR
ncbi:hypothetical protein KVR01_003673 [Diaporthe batatas]|uniref:uncharacterized protein n=1 Tax=Diaporthe batatas TaxID=748121 RepID=UPI001D05963A|nr:uncharacterized protein KVR01_003673 [Diaporthe batatas]KAG8167984.1 hypothetical protein KVR01_003673 [Diaporthe batatas]